MPKASISKIHSDESPVQVDYCRVVKNDEDGTEFVTYEKIDYPAVQARLGTWNDWSLSSLLKAGIDPAFSIHTGNPTRIEGVDAVNQMLSEVDSMMPSVNDIKVE